jgi:hypothetical protein
MDYAKKDPSQEESVSEVREPAVAYAFGGGAEVRPWADSGAADDEFDEEIPLGPDGRHLGLWRLDNDPAFREFVLRRSDEVDARIAAGTQVSYTTDEVCDRILWRIENHQWADVEERMKRNGQI